MIVEQVRRFLASRRITPCTIVVASSGGIDSTALLLAFGDLRADGFQVVCGHVNHHLRGAESDGDERFVRELCARLQIEVDVADGTLDDLLVSRSGIESAAREVRTERLRAIARQHRAQFIATAHQRNDQAETVIMRIITGTGLAGLRGIHSQREDGFIRPLLEVTRAELEAFLAERGVTARIDSSNADPRFLRNRVRALLRDFGSPAVDNAAAIAVQAQHLWPVVEAAIADHERRFTRISESETRFTGWPEDLWVRQALLQRQIRRLDPQARDVSARDLERLASSIDSIRRVSVTKSLELVARHGRLVLRRVPKPTAEFEFSISAGDEIAIAQTGATIRLIRPERGAALTASRRSIVRHQLFQVDGGTRSFTVRNRRRGDRFQPLGMPSDKKLKDFLIDRKIPVETRDSIPLLLCDGDIVWVGGVEVSESFKVTSPPGELYEVILEYGSHEGSHDDVQL